MVLGSCCSNGPHHLRIRLPVNIHDRARQLVAQSPHPMELKEAYARLARKATRRKKEPVDMTKVRLPYAD